MRINSQRARDSDRVRYRVTFPAGQVSEDTINGFFRTAAGVLSTNRGVSGVPSLVFELHAVSGEINHYIRVPRESADYLCAQLRAQIPGVALSPSAPELTLFGYGVRVGMADPALQLPVAVGAETSRRIIEAMRLARRDGDQVLLQWVITHSGQTPAQMEHQPRRTSVLLSLVGHTDPSKEEVAERKRKFAEANFTVVGRLAARSPVLGEHRVLVKQVAQALGSEKANNFFTFDWVRPKRLSAEIFSATTPLIMAGRFSVSELAPHVGWLLPDGDIAGLARNTALVLPVPDAVSATGIRLGVSSVPGSSRAVTVDAVSLCSHALLIGANGVGKTTLAVNMGRQIMAAGGGLFVVEMSGDLIRRLRDHVPRERIGEVIDIDFANPALNPVGFNVLEFGDANAVTGRVMAMLESIYPDLRSMNVRKLLMHGIPALMRMDKATLADLIPLFDPEEEEEGWVDAVIAAQHDRVIAKFLRNWHKRRRSGDPKIPQAIEPLANRMFELFTPEPVRYLLNQERSSFSPADIVASNKVLFVNLHGVPDHIASVVGGLLVGGIWEAAQDARNLPERPNFALLDEFQLYVRSFGNLEDMLATARKYKLGLIKATQYTERLDTAIQDAVMANSRTKVVFQSSVKSARLHVPDFASPLVGERHLVTLPAHHTVVKVNTPAGVVGPMTMRTEPEPAGVGLGSVASAGSNVRYGRTIASIEAADRVRRRVPEKTTRKEQHKPFGRASREDTG